jgi:hypothetical protein
MQAMYVSEDLCSFAYLFGLWMFRAAADDTAGAAACIIYGLEMVL